MISKAQKKILSDMNSGWTLKKKRYGLGEKLISDGQFTSRVSSIVFATLIDKGFIVVSHSTQYDIFYKISDDGFNVLYKTKK
jgi:hypothetical protein